MKLTLLFITTLVLSNLFFYSAILAQDDKVVSILTSENLTVTKTGEYFTLVPDDNDSQRYMPRNLDLKYRKEGLKVVVSGNVFAIPPNVRMIGTPLEITKIEVRNTTGNLQPPVKPKDATGGPQLQPNTEGNTSVKTGVGYAEVDYTTKLSNVKGTIVKIDNTFVIETGTGMRYLPMGNLPAEFMVEKTKVVFSGLSGNPPANVRMKGNPLKINAIEKAPTKRWWEFWK